MQQQQQQQSPYSQAQAVYNNAAGTQQGQWRQGPHTATQPQPAHLQQQGQYQVPANSSSGANVGAGGAGGAQPQGNYGYGHNAGAQQTLGAVNQQGPVCTACTGDIACTCSESSAYTSGAI